MNDNTNLPDLLDLSERRANVRAGAVAFSSLVLNFARACPIPPAVQLVGLLIAFDNIARGQYAEMGRDPASLLETVEAVAAGFATMGDVTDADAHRAAAIMTAVQQHMERDVMTDAVRFADLDPNTPDPRAAEALDNVKFTNEDAA